jgi:hypothetical protein
MKLNDTVWKALNRTQAERRVAMAMGYQRYAFADKHRHNADDEFVDRAFVQEGSYDLTATHHPDVLAFFDLAGAS